MSKFSKSFFIGILLFSFFLFIIYLIPLTNPNIQNQLNDSSTSKNFSGSGDWSYLDYIQLPKSATVTNAVLNLTGIK